LSEPIPVALFAYARPDHLRRALDSLRATHVPLIYAFSDGPRAPDKAAAVAEVRAMLRAIDWCEVVLCERETNLGLGVSIRTGVAEVLNKHDALLVVEDDLICVPGTYQYLCAALKHYRNEPSVMSITGWTHPRVIPPDVTKQPYFDGRAENLFWGTWRRVWQGMDRDAQTLMQDCRARGINVYRYGADLSVMAQEELTRNIWAVRFLYLHIARGGLALRPPHSMVEHIGWDMFGTNAQTDDGWSNPPLQSCPPIPDRWPAPVENPACARLWQQAYGSRPERFKLFNWAKRKVKRMFASPPVSPSPLRREGDLRPTDSPSPQAERGKGGEVK